MQRKGILCFVVVHSDAAWERYVCIYREYFFVLCFCCLSFPGCVVDNQTAVVVDCFRDVPVLDSSTL